MSVFQTWSRRHTFYASRERCKQWTQLLKLKMLKTYRASSCLTIGCLTNRNNSEYTERDRFCEMDKRKVLEMFRKERRAKMDINVVDIYQ